LTNLNIKHKHWKEELLIRVHMREAAESLSVKTCCQDRFGKMKCKVNWRSQPVDIIRH